MENVDGSGDRGQMLAATDSLDTGAAGTGADTLAGRRSGRYETATMTLISKSRRKFSLPIHPDEHPHGHCGK